MQYKAELMDGQALERSLVRISHEIIEKCGTCDNMCVVGIKTRGVPLADRVADYIKTITGTRPPVGTLDITLYRDDLTKCSEDPLVNKCDIGFDITGKTVILVDDVIYTGRTVRAALDALTAFGRAQYIKLAVVVDRGHRELPIRPDFIGKNIPTSKAEVISVKLAETDGETGVYIYSV